MKPLFGILVVAIAFCGETWGAIEFSFVGTVSHINDHGQPFLDSSIALGTTLAGSYVFDPNVADQFPGLAQLGDYRQDFAAGSNFGLNVGDYSLSFLGGYYHIQVENNTGSSDDDDKYEVGSGVGSWSFSNGLDEFSSVGFVLAFSDFGTGTAFSTDELPTALDLTAFDNDQGSILISIRDGLGGDTDIIATITDLSAPIPEPATIAILVLGVSIGRLRRRSL